MVVNSLYYGQAAVPSPRGEASVPVAVTTGLSISGDVIAAALCNIYRRDFNPHTDIEPNLFNAIADTLGQAVTTAAKATGRRAELGNPSLGDDPFTHALRHSTDVFSAFKVHRAQNDMAARLLDSNGNLKPFEQWRDEVLPIASHQCGPWLETEYNTAVLRARQAANWQQFEAEKDILPNLKWLPSTSPNPGADHRPFWNTVLPVDHPFWDQHRPGDRWNCKCDLTSTDEPPTPAPSGSPAGNNPQPGLKDNPGKTAEIFDDTHPYIKNAYSGAKKAVDSLMARIDEMAAEMPAYLTHDEKRAIALNNLEIEKGLSLKKGKVMSVEDADKQSANPNHSERFILDPKGAYVDRSGNRYSLNPNYQKSDEQYSINCATCAPAYVLRLRGFDITAKGRIKGSGSLNDKVASGKSFDLWKNADGTPAKANLTADWMTKKGYKQMSESRYKEYFEEACQNEGVYVLTIGWKGGGGHATILQRGADGKLYYIEPQAYDKSLGAKRSIAELCKKGAVKPLARRGIMRVDNKVFDTSYLDLFNSKKKR